MQTEGTAYISVDCENNQCSIVGMNLHICRKYMQGSPHAEPHGALSSQLLDFACRECSNSRFGQWTPGTVCGSLTKIDLSRLIYLIA